MARQRTEAEKELDVRHNEAARREVVRAAQERSATENLEEAMRLLKQAQKFARASAPLLDAREE